jgi:hypothetical protein
MKSSRDGNDPQALKEYLYELICQAKRPEEVELLVEVVLSIQHALRAAPNRPDLLATDKTGAAGFRVAIVPATPI